MSNEHDKVKVQNDEFQKSVIRLCERYLSSKVGIAASDAMFAVDERYDFHELLRYHFDILLAKKMEIIGKIKNAAGNGSVNSGEAIEAILAEKFNPAGSEEDMLYQKLRKVTGKNVFTNLDILGVGRDQFDNKFLNGLYLAFKSIVALVTTVTILPALAVYAYTKNFGFMAKLPHQALFTVDSAELVKNIKNNAKK